MNNSVVTTDLGSALEVYRHSDVAMYSALVGYIDRLGVSTTDSTIVLDAGGFKQRVFVGLSSITANKTISVTNTSMAIVLNFMFTLSGTQTLTFPSNFRMQTADTRWTAGSKLFTPTEAGTYEASMVFDGTNWNLKISTPFT